MEAMSENLRHRHHERNILTNATLLETCTSKEIVNNTKLEINSYKNKESLKLQKDVEKKSTQKLRENSNSNASKCFWFASLAGLFGALSGLNGKFAVASTNVPERIASWLTSFMLANKFIQNEIHFYNKNDITGYLSWILRFLFFLTNALCTGLMWRYYIKSLQFGPTAVCQIVNTGVNFAVSAFAGLIFFNEDITLMWACGAFLIVIGLSIVVTDK